jgi:hypothetical protein
LSCSSLSCSSLSWSSVLAISHLPVVVPTCLDAWSVAPCSCP